MLERSPSRKVSFCKVPVWDVRFPAYFKVGLRGRPLSAPDKSIAYTICENMGSQCLIFKSTREQIVSMKWIAGLCATHRRRGVDRVLCPTALEVKKKVAKRSRLLSEICFGWYTGSLIRERLRSGNETIPAIRVIKIRDIGREELPHAAFISESSPHGNGFHSEWCARIRCPAWKH